MCERQPLRLLPFLLLQQAALLILQLFDAGAFDLRLALAARHRLRIPIPPLLPRGQCLFTAHPELVGAPLLLVPGVEPGNHRGQFAGQGFELATVAQDDSRQLLHLGLRLLQVGGLALAQFPGVLNALFDAGHLRAGSVEPRLDGPQRVGFGRLVDANPLDLRLGFPQIGKHRMQGGFTVLGGGIAQPGVRIQAVQAQRQQFRLQFALLFLERLVAPSRCRLALQMTNLFFDFLAQIVQAVEILARVSDAVLGLAAALFIAGDSRGLLEKGTQVIGARLDDARDHPLLDDGVAARTQSGAEE